MDDDPKVIEKQVGDNEKLQDIECRYCGDKENPKRVAHMVCVETEDDDGESHIHVHAPFEDRRVMYRMMDAIEEQMVKHKRGDTKKKAEELL